MPNPLSPQDTFIACRELSERITKLNSENAAVKARFAGKQEMTPQFEQECSRRQADAEALTRTLQYLQAGCECGQTA